ncbi:RNA 2',3'-cyclic phosphodiesterase [Luteococcus sp. OSA5]|uniref:RNA 2',3'-cyclic phosphodiesterase n=1 Tax=Luteococcus sp. OSA5 TaxID=3401630 RepID=UPI003B42F2D6
MTTRRLFTAILPPLRVRQELLAQLPESRRDDAGLRLTQPSWWHVTLTFTGSVPEAALPHYRRALAVAADSQPPFPLSIAGGDAFPRLSSGRHVMALLDDPLGGLPALAHAGRQAALDARISVEDRAYRPHLTVGRTNRPRDLRGQAGWLQGLRTEPWQATQMVLVETLLDPRGGPAAHRIVDRWELAG